VVPRLSTRRPSEEPEGSHGRPAYSERFVREKKKTHGESGRSWSHE
jgi:hypothetical protein